MRISALLGCVILAIAAGSRKSRPKRRQESKALSSDSESSAFQSVENSPAAPSAHDIPEDAPPPLPLPQKHEPAASPASTCPTLLSRGTTASAPRLERDSESLSVSESSSEGSLSGDASPFRHPGALVPKSKRDFEVVEAPKTAGAALMCVVSVNCAPRGSYVDKHWVYELCVISVSGERPRSVPQRRFSDFAKLHDVLLSRNMFRALPPLPPKDGMYLPIQKLWTYFAPNPAHVAERVRLLNIYMAVILAHPVLRRDHALHLFLDAHTDAYATQSGQLVRAGDNGGMPMLHARTLTPDTWPSVAVQSWTNWLDAERWVRDALAALSSRISVLDAHIRTERHALDTDVLTLGVAKLAMPTSQTGDADRLARQCQRASKVRPEALCSLETAKDAALVLQTKFRGLEDMVARAKKLFVDGWQACADAFARASLTIADCCARATDEPSIIAAARRDQAEALAGAATLLALRERGDADLGAELSYAAECLESFQSSFTKVLSDLNCLRATIAE